MSLSEQESAEHQDQLPQDPKSSTDHEITPPSPDQAESNFQEELAVNTGEPHSADQDSAKHSAHRQQFEKFLSELEKLSDLESKLQYAVDFMEASLAQGGTPHFKSFWEARNICLQLFKENISPAVRSILWAKYSDLSKEARRLKEILDEQSAFAVEQIEIAVKALEDDIESVNTHLEKLAPIQFDISSQVLSNSLPTYEKLQRELNLLNTQASRINAMRKELIRTEMRVRQKNKFFQRLSAAGDKVFPRRKELIKEVSQQFITDVDAFIAQHFAKEDFGDSLFALREEIKSLQNMAKFLTLNTHSFTHTRMRLSECWDKIKSEDKERKKERHHQKEIYKQNYDSSMKLIEEFNQTYQSEQPSAGEATKRLDELVTHIRNLELGRDELRTLRENVQAARKPILEKIQAHEQERANLDAEKDRQRRQLITDVKQQAEQLLKSSDTLEADAIESQRNTILETMAALPMSKLEKQEIERQLKPLRDLISEKKESSLLAMSEGDRQSLQQLREVLKQRKERRQEIKAQIDTLRKASGSSGLDFEQAMNFNAQVAVEKERLEKVNQGIEEVEHKIIQLKRSV